MSTVLFPYGYIPDPEKGKPLDSADIFIGKPGLDPAIVANQITVFEIQEDGTKVSITQPIKTGAGGVPITSGSAAVISVDENEYSIKINDKLGAQKYFQEFVSGIVTFIDLNDAIEIAVDDLLERSLINELLRPVTSSDLGNIYNTSEYNTGTNSGPGKYKLVNVNPGFNLINPQKTDGSGFYLELILDGDLFIENAGAYDGKIDSTAEIQECINSQSINLGNKVRIGQGTFNFTSIYFYFDVTNNPEFSQVSGADGQIWLDGSGRSVRISYPSNMRGTVLNCTKSSGIGVNLGKTGTFSRTVSLTNMNIIGDIDGTLVYQVATALESNLYNLFIVNANELATSVALYTNRVWGSNWELIEIYGVTDTNLGTGLHYDVLNASDGGGSGGNNVFELVSCDRFAKPAVFGRVFDPLQVDEGDFSKLVTLKNFQSRRSTEGLTIQHGIRSMLIENFWGEANSVCHIRLRDRCGAIHIKNGIYSFASEGLICEGISGGTLDQNTVEGVTVEEPDFAFLDVAGYRRYGTDESGVTNISKVRAHNNGGTVVVADDRYQRINLDISSWDGNIARTIRDETNTNAPQLVNHGSVNSKEVIVSAGATVDYSTWLSVPGFLRCSSTGVTDISVILPTPGDGSDFDSSICAYDVITIQKDSPLNNVNVSGGFTATLTADDETLTLKGTAAGWKQVYS